MSNRVFELELKGLDCMSCAAKVERAVRQLSGVQTADLNFATGRLRVTHGLEQESGLISTAADLIRRIEPHLTITSPGIPASPAHSRGHGHGCGGDCCHDGGHGRAFGEAETGGRDRGASGGLRFRVPRLGAGAALLAAALLLPVPSPFSLLLYIGAYLVIGFKVLWTAVRNILRGEIFDENFLMTAATVGAFAIGEYPEAVAVMLFYEIGELLQSLAVNRSRRSIGALMDIRPDFAHRVTENGGETVSPFEVAVGERILIKPGERVPLDGRVIEGRSSLDTAALTGEALPRPVSPGSEVLSGSVNLTGLLTVEVTRPAGESTASRILDLVQNAGAKKAKTERFITRFARYYTPAVVFVALALAVIPPLVLGDGFAEWLSRALVFLVISCPCALVVSVPLGFFGGISAASSEGVLVKGGNYLELLKAVDTVVFDKTGTLTRGVFEVDRVVPGDGFTEPQLLELAALAESHSGHPIAQSILRAYGKAPDASQVAEYEELAGHGVGAVVNGRRILAGNERLMASQGISVPPGPFSSTVVHLAADGVYAGCISISDRLKEDSKGAVAGLREAGVRRVVMLTGDSPAAAEPIGRELMLDELHAGLLPHEKVEIVESLLTKKSSPGSLLFVGDGINDAPVLARADVGVAMGGVGSDAAIEAADVVLMNDEPSRLIGAIKVARRTDRIVRQNIVFALGVKGLVLLLGAMGLANMWLAVFADVGVTLLAVFNALRVIRKRRA